jgi:hypothetical protein
VGVLVALAVLALATLAVVVTAAAFARFVDPETWRVETAWALRPRLAGAIERVAFFGLDPLRALVLWLVLVALLVGFLAIPALFYLLGEVF